MRGAVAPRWDPGAWGPGTSGPGRRWAWLWVLSAEPTAPGAAPARAPWSVWDGFVLPAASTPRPRSQERRGGRETLPRSWLYNYYCDLDHRFLGVRANVKGGSPACTPGLALTPGRRAGVAQVGALGPCSMLGVGGLPSACGRGRDGVGSCPGVNPHLRSARLDLPPAAGRDPDPRTRCRVRSGQPRPQVTARGR